MPKNYRQKFKYYENKKSFSDEIKSNFHHFWRAIIEANKKNVFLEGESPNLNAIVKVRRNSCDQVFLGMTLSKKIYHNSDGSSSHQLVLSYRYFSTNNKNENMEILCQFHIIQKSLLLKTMESHFSVVLLKEWCIYPHLWVKLKFLL